MSQEKKSYYESISKRLSMPPLICGSVSYKSDNQPIDSENSGLPLVTVVTTTYNAQKFLPGAIDSVRNQTYPNIEYILIDGGSTDDTLNIVKANKDLINCDVSEADNGIYDAMNKGLQRARGKYVCLLNADDRFYPEFIAKNVQKLEKSGADIAYSDYETEDQEVNVNDINDGLFFSQLGIKHNTFLMRATCFSRIGGFDDNLGIVADAKWNRAAYASGLKFVKVPGIHTFYSTKGLSAAATPNVREKIISESVSVLMTAFLELDRSQAEMLYLSNFNCSKADKILELYHTFKVSSPILANAIKESTDWNIANRPGYTFKQADDSRMIQVFRLCNEMGIDAGRVQFDGDAEEDARRPAALEAFAKILDICDLAASEKSDVCIHFARVFSRSSETFIHEFLLELDESDAGTLHVMLCDERHNADTRLYPHILHVPWDKLSGQVRTYLYDMIWAEAKPAKIVAHFALNGWHLHNRLKWNQRNGPWINVCHGIDVFVIGGNPEYTDYIQNYCSLATNVIFTAVSTFLLDQLEAQGVPKKKLCYVPNAVANRFWGTRKSSGYWKPGRPLRILTIGRLIDWKGHDVLLESLADFKAAHPDTPFELEIVYGRFGEKLSSLQNLAKKLRILSKVTFTDYVNFGENPEFIASFDMFVLPSTLSGDAIPRTETFGVAMIEAISSGLPVIGTTAGGIPEVIGRQNNQAVIVPHGNAEELTKAIAKFVANRTKVFRNNKVYAKDRVDAFSSRVRMRKWRAANKNLEKQGRTKKYVHFCSLGKGGAAGAAMNIHLGLLRKGYNSIYVTRSIEEVRIGKYTPNVVYLSPEFSIDFEHNSIARRPGFTTYSVNDHMISDETIFEIVKDADVINLAWYAKFISVQNVAMMTKLGIPVVITLRDMFSISGGCHFFHGCNQWKASCSGCPQLVNNQDDYSAKVMDAKIASWNFDAITFAALSENSMRILEKSKIASNSKHVKLSNYVNSDIFYPDDSKMKGIQSRLATNAVTIGYLPSFESRIKGNKELYTALNIVHKKKPDARIILLVASDNKVPIRSVPYRIVQVDAIKDFGELRKFYNMADVVAVPSSEETFSNTAIEALACGTPVIGFKTGVMDELLSHKQDFGAAVDVHDVQAYADAIIKFYDKENDREKIASKIASLYNEKKRIQAYVNLFNTLSKEKTTKKVRLNSVRNQSLDILEQVSETRKVTSIKRRLVHSRDQRNHYYNQMRKEQRSLEKANEKIKTSAIRKADLEKAQSEIVQLKQKLQLSKENAKQASQVIPTEPAEVSKTIFTQKKNGVYCFGYQTGENYEMVQCRFPKNYDLGQEFSDTVFQVQKLPLGFYVKIQKKHIEFMNMPQNVILLPFWKIKSDQRYRGEGQLSVFNAFSDTLSDFFRAGISQELSYRSDSEKTMLAEAFVNFSGLETVEPEIKTVAQTTGIVARSGLFKRAGKQFFLKLTRG